MENGPQGSPGVSKDRKLRRYRWEVQKIKQKLKRAGEDVPGDTVDENLPASGGDTDSILGPGRPHT